MSSKTVQNAEKAILNLNSLVPYWQQPRVCKLLQRNPCPKEPICSMKIVLLSRNVMRHQTWNVANSIEISEDISDRINGHALRCYDMSMTNQPVEALTLVTLL